jgi:hypothetical protein
MLFILAIDPLQQILNLKNQHGILTPLPLNHASSRTSLYIDDTSIFFNPIRKEVTALKEIIHILAKLQNWSLILGRVPFTQFAVRGLISIMSYTLSKVLKVHCPASTRVTICTLVPYRRSMFSH